MELRECYLLLLQRYQELIDEGEENSRGFDKVMRKLHKIQKEGYRLIRSSSFRLMKPVFLQYGNYSKYCMSIGETSESKEFKHCFSY